MDYTGPPPVLFTALYILIALAFVAIAFWRGERARSQQAQELTRARTKRAYRSFLALGVFLVIIAAGLLGTAGRPFHEQQGYGMMLGLFAGVPAAIALVIGMFHALMVWRVTLIKLLLLPTMIVLVLFFTNELRSTDFPASPWGEVIAACYVLLVIVVSVRGLLGLRTTAKS